MGRPLLHRLAVGFRQDGGAAVLANILRIVADQAVALARDTMLDLTGCGDLEAFLHTAFGLQLGHFHLLLGYRVRDTYNQPWQPLRPDRQMNHVSVKGAHLAVPRAKASQKWAR